MLQGAEFAEPILLPAAQITGPRELLSCLLEAALVQAQHADGVGDRGRLDAQARRQRTRFEQQRVGVAEVALE